MKLQPYNLKSYTHIGPALTTLRLAPPSKKFAVCQSTWFCWLARFNPTPYSVVAFATIVIAINVGAAIKDVRCPFVCQSVRQSVQMHLWSADV